MLCIQRVQATRSAVSVTDCVFRHVSCVMDTHSVVITATKPTALKTTVRTAVAQTHRTLNKFVFSLVHSKFTFKWLMAVNRKQVQVFSAPVTK